MTTNFFNHSMTGNETLLPAKVFIPDTNARIDVIYIKEMSAVVGINGGLYLPHCPTEVINTGIDGSVTLFPAYQVSDEGEPLTLRLGYASKSSVIMFNEPDGPYMSDWKPFTTHLIYDKEGRNVISTADCITEMQERFDTFREASGRQPCYATILYWSDYPEPQRYLLGLEILDVTDER